MGHRLRAAFLAALFATLVAFPVWAASPEKVVLAYPSISLAMLPFYVAQEAGMYKQENIEIEFVRVGAGNDYPALLSGQADVVHSNLVDPMTLRQKGQDVVAIGQFGYNFSTQFVLGKKYADAKGITTSSSLKDKVRALKGARLAASGQGAGTDQQLRFLASLYGLDFQKDIHVTYIKEGGAALAALVNGQIDGFVHTTPFYEMAIERGDAIMLVNFARGEVPEADGYIQNALVSTSKIIATKKERLVKFLRATSKAMAYIHDPAHRDDIVGIATKYVTDGKSSKAEMRPFVEEMLANNQFPTTVVLDEKRFNVSRDFRNAVLKVEGQPPLDFKYADVVNNDLAAEAEK